ncbi:homogentisate 1,2-dioxygenase, partial [Aeromonas sp. CPF2-S1]|nr:homogentisate 1,2-dioxygenase [Aeromonas sp. CPF2-S1]
RGMVTFHPAGFTHGPHPKAFAAGLAHAKTFTDEVAVMLDTRDALNVGSLCERIENTRYVSSWQRPDAAAGK